MMKYILILLLIIIILLLPYLNVKIRHKFWFKQPVTHYYNMVILEEGYITDNLPIKPIQIPESYSIVNLNINDINILSKWCKLLQECYIPISNKILNYKLTIDFLKYSLQVPNQNSNFLLGLMKNDSLIGSITSRPLLLSLKNIKVPILYVDYLCIGKDYRKQNLAPLLISQMAYQGYVEPYKCFIFKKEIYSLPYNYIVRYDTYLIDRYTTINIKLQDHNISYHRLTSSSPKSVIVECYNYYIIHSKRFKIYQIYTLPEFNYYLIQNPEIYSYYIIKKKIIMGLMVFFNNQYYYNNYPSLELYLYIRSYFNPVFLKIIQTLENRFRYLYISNIGYNGELLSGLSNKTYSNNNYLHLYNYHLDRVKKQDVLLSFY